jgi:hypothetical protein
MSAHELRLLIRREGHHGELRVVMERRENPIVDAEVRMAHVRAFDGSLHTESHPAEVIGTHSQLLSDDE